MMGARLTKANCWRPSRARAAAYLWELRHCATANWRDVHIVMRVRPHPGGRACGRSICGLPSGMEFAGGSPAAHPVVWSLRAQRVRLTLWYGVCGRIACGAPCSVKSTGAARAAYPLVWSLRAERVRRTLWYEVCGRIAAGDPPADFIL